MNEIKDWLWLVKTNKGDFFISVIGPWTEEEAAKNVRVVFDKIKVDIIALIPRKRATGDVDATGTIHQPKEPTGELGFEFLGGKKLWEACGRGTEYEAEWIRLKKGMDEEDRAKEKRTVFHE